MVFMVNSNRRGRPMIPLGYCSMRSTVMWVLPVLVGPSTAVTPAPQFVEFSPAPPAEPGGRVEICIGGVVVRVRESLDVAHLARIVAAVAGIVPPC